MENQPQAVSNAMYDDIIMCAKQIRKQYDNSDWYVDKKLEKLESLKNVWNEPLKVIQMFDSENLKKFKSICDKRTWEYFKSCIN